MTRSLAICLLLLALTGPARAQTAANVLVIEGQPKADVASSFGLVQDYQTGFQSNRAKLQAKLDGGPPQYPWFFPGGATNLKSFLVDDSLVIPPSTGRKWTGCGFMLPQGSSASDWGSRLVLRARDHATTLDGATNRLTSNKGGATVVVTGRNVTSRDLYNSVEITGGMNATPGWYGIVDVTPGVSGVGTWTLDRAWCSGAVADGAGYYCPAIVTNRSLGTIHEGLAFSSHVLPSDRLDAQVLYHICTNQQSDGLNTGKHVFRDCGFAYSQVGILCGNDLAGAYSDDADWLGRVSNHADHLRTDHCMFYRCATAILARNEQSLVHVHSHLTAFGVTDAVFRFDAGGKLTANGVEVAGKSGTQCLLRLGPRVSTNTGVFAISGFSFDGGDSTRNPQLVVTDWTNLQRRAVVTVEHGIIARARENDGYPLVDIQSGCLLRLRDIIPNNHAGAGINVNDIRLRNGSSGYKPHVVIEGCVLGVTTDPEEVIDEANCDPGITVEFFGNCQPNGTALANKTYVTKGRGDP